MQHVQSEQHARRPHDLEDSGFKRQHPNPTPHSSCQGFLKITNKLWMMAQLFRVVQDRLQFKSEMSESQRKLNLLCVLGEPLTDYGTKEGVQFQTSHGSCIRVNFEVTDAKIAILPMRKGADTGIQASRRRRAHQGWCGNQENRETTP